MRRPIRLACLAAAALGLGLPAVAAACSIAPPPEPPPRMPGESAEQFSARSLQWYRDHDERRRLELLPERTALEERLWASAERVVLARVVKTGSIRLRDSERQWFKSSLATLRPIRWLRGRSAVRRLGVHDLSDDSCDGGAGEAPESEPGELLLIFYGPGPVDPLNVLDSFSLARAATPRTREAFAAAAAGD